MIYESDGCFVLHLYLFRYHGDFDVTIFWTLLKYHLDAFPLPLPLYHPHPHIYVNGDDGAPVFFRARCRQSYLQSDDGANGDGESDEAGIVNECVSGYVSISIAPNAQEHRIRDFTPSRFCMAIGTTLYSC